VLPAVSSNAQNPLSAHGTVARHWGNHFLVAQIGHEGDRLPSSKRNGANHPDATRGSPSQSRHVRADGSLVDEHQTGWIKHTLLSYPPAARSRHICSLPFDCLQGFF